MCAEGVDDVDDVVGENTCVVCWVMLAGFGKEKATVVVWCGVTTNKETNERVMLIGVVWCFK